MSSARGLAGGDEQRSVDGTPLIFLVDDDQIERLVGREFFESLGFEVCDLASGRDCLKHAAILHPDLIILDVMMPGIDGFEVCRRIRADADLAYTPVLMVTSLDDERSIVDAVATALRYEGFHVREEATGRGAIQAVVEFEPDLVVLDWMLPDLEGIEVGRRLRDRGFKTAILFLTAKDAVENKVEALRAGGDDYVTKPFSLAEIVARVQAILRRTGGELPGDVLRFADVTLDESRHEVFRGGTRVELTATEFALLRFFLLNPRRVLSKGQILQNVWNYDFGGNSNVVETYVSYLRRKLHAEGTPLIKTVRQAGYMLEADLD